MQLVFDTRFHCDIQFDPKCPCDIHFDPKCRCDIQLDSKCPCDIHFNPECRCGIQLDSDAVDTLMRNGGMQQKVQYLKLVITKYIEIVQKQISDLTVKYIVCFLVKKVLDYIREDLVLTLLASSNFESLTEDCDEDFRIKGGNGSGLSVHQRRVGGYSGFSEAALQALSNRLSSSREARKQKL
ncbi:dynamin-1 [Caerostris darwini]|uniref:Dynamin-1 n=1 Tax=Caerostris darwini TaxID=1538125 RepID=A0AAV4U1Z6_9ARAC|nr:dynamin-1 [Caerostris darwini]